MTPSDQSTQRGWGADYERDFYERPPDDVARDLVGSLLVLYDKDTEVRALVVETEAYDGANDAASHAYRGLTARNAVMFGPGGFLYVYLSYGIHWCMNVVTRGEGVASAVLLRGAEIVESRESGTVMGAELRGPGNLTRGLGVTGADNGRDCCASSGRRVAFCGQWIAPAGFRIGRSARIGISHERDRLSRYFLEGHPAVSRHPT